MKLAHKMTFVGLLVVTILLLSQGAALAVPITYIETATASGSLGGVAFTNAVITLTAEADTTNVSPPPGAPSPSLFIVNNGFAAVDVAGLGGAAFTVPTQTFDNQGVGTPTPVAGMVALVNGPEGPEAYDILDAVNSAFGSYDLATSLGPLSSGSRVNLNIGTPTSSGPFVITSQPPLVTFQAIVPEPSSIAIGGFMPLLAIGRLGRRVRR